MKVSAGNRGTSFSNDRQVSFTVTGLANNDYSRTADVVMNVPYTRMNETMRLVQRMGGWQSINILAKHYSHLTPVSDREQIDRAMSPQTKKSEKS